MTASRKWIAKSQRKKPYLDASEFMNALLHFAESAFTDRFANNVMGHTFVLGFLLF